VATLETVPAPIQVAVEASTTTISAINVPLPGMTLVPGVAGNYAVWFTTSLSHSANNSAIDIILRLDGVEVAHTQRHYRRGTGGAQESTLAFQAYLVGVTATDVIDLVWNTSKATATSFERSLLVWKVP
jgi:hypothetical protein